MKFLLRILLTNLVFVLIFSQMKEDLDKALFKEKEKAKFKIFAQKLKKYIRKLQV